MGDGGGLQSVLPTRFTDFSDPFSDQTRDNWSKPLLLSVEESQQCPPTSTRSGFPHVSMVYAWHYFMLNSFCLHMTCSLWPSFLFYLGFIVAVANYEVTPCEHNCCLCLCVGTLRSHLVAWEQRIWWHVLASSSWKAAVVRITILQSSRLEMAWKWPVANV